MLGLDDPAILVLLFIASTCAGFVDAMVGGGGLILIPALLLGLPSLPPAMALGTNKFAAVSGTLTAAITYHRKIPVSIRQIFTFALPALLLSMAGALIAIRLDSQVLRPIILIAVVIIGIILIFKPDLGQSETDEDTSRFSQALLFFTICIIGLYDGFFGPGTGMFLILAISILGKRSFLNATSLTKIINSATNVGALVIFIASGSILIYLGVLLAIGNIIGAQLGSRLVLKRGTGLIRAAMFLLIAVLVVKLGAQMIA